MLDRLRQGALAGARRLDLACGLRAVPDEVLALADTLEVLNLTGNRLTQLPHWLPRLRHLRVLFASDNLFAELPEVVGDCPALQVVGFKANQIAQVSGVALPPQLRWLILTDNQIAQLPPALGQRPALEKLMLAGNRLTALPDSLADAHNLALVRLAANRLDAWPLGLTALPRLAWVALAGNPASPRPPQAAALPVWDWSGLQLGRLLGLGASGQIHAVTQALAVQGDARGLALKLFKGAVTSDGLPADELAASLAAGQHPALCTPVATLGGHPQGTPGLVLPLIPPHWVNLAQPPSLDSCSRDVYPPGAPAQADALQRLARDLASALAHLHAQGLMHGDFYGHNILWDCTTGQAQLGDFGAATWLPPGPERHAWQALEVLAFGHLLQELLDLWLTHVPPPAAWSPLVVACRHPQPRHRPTLAEVVAAL